MLSAAEIIIFFLPILLAIVVGVATIVMIVAKSTVGIKTAISLIVWGILSLLMFVFTISYLFGPDCVFCYDPPKLRLAAEFFIGVVIYGLIGLALVWWVRQA